MARETVYLVVRVDRTVRAAKRPRLNSDEVAFPIHLTYPNNWGRVQQNGLEIAVPDFMPEVQGPTDAEVTLSVEGSTPDE